jgi:hypothetical protein
LARASAEAVAASAAFAPMTEATSTEEAKAALINFDIVTGPYILLRY